MSLPPLLLIFIGGGAGSVARYLVSNAARAAGAIAGLPIGTLAVNLIGALCIGILAALFAGRGGEHAPRLLLITGFLGGFTTFSAFSLEMAQFYQTGNYQSAFLYAAVSVIGTLALVCAGMALARFF